MLFKTLALTASLVAAATGALADGPAPQDAEPMLALPAQPVARDPALVFTVGLGGGLKPAYFGSDEYEFGPSGSFAFHSLNIGRFSFGDPDPTVDRLGFGPRGSFRFIGARDASEYSELAGLNDIDAAVELGLGLGYTARNFSAFADVRRGFGGHEAWVAEAGADLIARPTDALTVTFGPRFLWGDDDYTQTYFGVTPAESAASGTLAAYAPQGGLVSSGLELGMSYRLDDNWGLEGSVTYDRFNGDAENSPIVRQGSRDQWGVTFGVTRVIRIGG